MPGNPLISLIKAKINYKPINTRIKKINDKSTGGKFSHFYLFVDPMAALTRMVALSRSEQHIAFYDRRTLNFTLDKLLTIG
jgi:hypothetical protein